MMSMRRLMVRVAARRSLLQPPALVQSQPSPLLLWRTYASSIGNVSHIKNTPHLKRKLGQHLLVSEKILAQIVDAAHIPALLHDKQERVSATTSDADAALLRILEIGPGTGNLTSALLNTSPRVHVHAIEYDTRMVERLAERFRDEPERLTIEQKDFEDFAFASHALLPADASGADTDDMGDTDNDRSSSPNSRRTSGRAARKLARLTKKSLEAAQTQQQTQEQEQRLHFDACVANIPYQLSSIIVSRLSSYMHRFPTHFRCAVLLVQEEFALRLLAQPGEQNYSRLSVNTALVADVTSVVKVGRAHFLPPPKVDSRVIKLVPRAAARLAPANDTLFFQRFDAMLRVCFLRKNKTLRALLLSKTARAHLEPLDADAADAESLATRIEAALSECELSASRAVQIPVDDFLRLMQALETRGVVFRPSTTRHFRD